MNLLIQSENRRLRSSLIAALAAACLVLTTENPARAQAQTTWNNTGTDFNTSSDWTGGLPSTTNYAVFSNAKTDNPNLSASLTVGGLDFTAGAYTLTSTSTAIAFTLTSSTVASTAATTDAIYDSFVGSTTINAPLVFAAGSTGTLTAGSAGAATTGSISTIGVLTSGSVVLTLSGQLSGSSVVLNYANVGQVTLNAANSYTAGGSTTFTNGATTLTSIGTILSGSGKINIGNSAAFSSGDVLITGTETLIAQTNLSGTSALANNFDLGTNVTFANGAVADNLQLNGAITFYSSQSLINDLDSGSTLTLGGTLSFSGISTQGDTATIKENGNTLLDITGTMQDYIGGKGTSSSVLVIEGNAGAGGGLIIDSGNNANLGTIEVFAATGTLSSGIAASVETLELNTATGLPYNNLQLGSATSGFNGGVVGLTASSGEFTLSLGTGANTVKFTGSGGFAAYGANESVSIGGAGTPTTLTWASTSSFLGNGYSLILGSPGSSGVSGTASTATVNFMNPIVLNATSVGEYRVIDAEKGTGTNIDGILSGAITDGAAASGLTKAGLGTLQVTGDNTYTGGTEVTAGTFLADSVSSSVGTGALQVGTVANASITGGVTTSGSNSVTVTSTAGLYAGQAITTSAGIPTGTNIAAVLNGNTLLLTQNAAAAGTGLTFTTSATTATLGGVGVIAASSVLINPGSVLAPGDPGTTIGATGSAAPIGSHMQMNAASTANYLTLAGTSTLLFKLGTVAVNGATNDQLEIENGVTGSVVFNSNAVNFTDLSSGSLAATSYTLVLNDAGTNIYSNLTKSGTDAYGNSIITGGLTINSSTDGLSAYTAAGDTVDLALTSNDNIVLDIAAVPEPSVMVLLGLGGLFCLFRFRKSHIGWC